MKSNFENENFPSRYAYYLCPTVLKDYYQQLLQLHIFFPIFLSTVYGDENTRIDSYMQERKNIQCEICQKQKIFRCVRFQSIYLGTSGPFIFLVKMLIALRLYESHNNRPIPKFVVLSSHVSVKTCLSYGGFIVQTLYVKQTLLFLFLLFSCRFYYKMSLYFTNWETHCMYVYFFLGLFKLF